MKKKTSPVFWVAFAAVAVALYVLATPPEPKAKPKKRTTVAKKVDSKGGFTADDYRDPFPAVNVQARNAFMPLVIRRDSASLVGSLPANALPSFLAGGDGSWVYTGTAEVDGVPMALLENRGTGESVFLKHGERFKQATVTRITRNSVSFAGPMGLNQTLRLVSDDAAVSQPSGGQSTVPGGGFAPAQVQNPPPLAGQIGNLTAVPEGRRRNNRNNNEQVPAAPPASAPAVEINQ